MRTETGNPVPTVSAIITTFNRERFLVGALQSALGQTYRDFELLVLDNSSADGTPALIARQADPRIRYVRHPPLGIAAARNLGVREAQGEFVAFLDDDDEWLPGKLEQQVAAFRGCPAGLGLVYGGFTRIDERGVEVETHHPALRGKILSELLWQRDAFTGSASNPMMRASVLRSLGGFDEALATSEDWELYLRLAERFEVESVPDVLLRIRTHRGSRLGDRIEDARRVEEVVLHRFGPRMNARLRSLYLRKIGGKLCRTGAVRQGRERLREAIRADPLNPVAYAQYGLSLLGAAVYRRVHDSYRRRRPG
jgi:glycosyltransferase involved in cell wall biosynthesis